MAEWQPIETAPKDRAILVYGLRYSGEGYQEVTHWYSDRWPIEWMEGYHTPTHWQPLPDPPA